MITEISSFIKKYRWTIISLVVITFLGALIRYYGSFVEPYAIYFHLDDSGHIWRSGFNFTDGISTNLPEIFFNSYKDAHPPLRNLFLNIIFRFIDDVYFVRLVSFIPGVLLIPISFFYGYYLFDGQEKQINLKIGLLVSTIVSFSHPLIFLSMSTRPYSLMLFFLVASLTAFFAFLKKQSNLALVSFFLMAILASFSHYSSFVVIAFCFLILGIFIFTKKLSRSIFLLGSIAFISVQTFQLSQLLKHGTLGSLTGTTSPGYIQSYFLNNYEEFFQYSKKFFSIFFFPSEFIFNPTLITVVGLLFFLGLVILLYRKHYFAFMISIVPLIFAVLLACFKLYPFDYFRHSIYLLPCLLVAFLAFALDFLKIKNKPLSFFLVFLFLFSYLCSQRLFTDPQKYISIYTPRGLFLPGILRKADYEDIKDIVLTIDEKQYFYILEDDLHKKLGTHIMIDKLNLFLSCDDNESCYEKTNFNDLMKSYKETIRKDNSYTVNKYDPIKYKFDKALVNNTKNILLLASSQMGEEQLLKIYDKLAAYKLVNERIEDHWFLREYSKI